MEEMDVPIEKIQEDIHHEAQHSGVSWISEVALSSALLAVLAAISALLAGHHSNEAMISQIQASDQWSYYQAKGIKSAILGSRLELLRALGRGVSEKENEKFADYKKEQEEIIRAAKEREAESHHHLHTHHVLARATTLFQIAIAVGAISALTRRRRFWLGSIAIGLIGAAFFLQGLLSR